MTRIFLGSILVILSLLFAGLPALDLMGGESNEGLSLQEQKGLYQELFGTEDSEVRGRRAELAFAQSLFERSSQPEVEPIRAYMYQRIEELLDGHSDNDAIDVRLAVMQERMALAVTEENLERYQELLEQRIKKARGDDIFEVAGRIADVMKQRAMMSLAAKDFKSAESQFKDLMKWHKKMRNKEGVAITKEMLKTLDRYQDRAEDLEKLQKNAQKKPGDEKAQVAVGKHLFADGAWEEASQVLRAAPSSPEAVGLHLLSEMMSDQASEQKLDLPAAFEAIQAGLASEKDDQVRRRLLEAGEVLHELVEQAGDNKVLTMKVSLLSKQWQEALQKLGPDPYADLAQMGSSASLDEAQLVSSGWVRVFDRKEPVAVRDGNEENVTVVGGNMVVDAKEKQQVVLGNFPEVAGFTGMKFRVRADLKGVANDFYFQFISDLSAAEGVKVFVKGSEVRVSASYSNELGVFEIKQGWNDITIIWKNLTYVVSINGENAIPLKTKKEPMGLKLWVRKGSKPLQIQSILGLPK